MFIRIRPPKWSMALLLLGGAVGVVAQDASDSLTRWYRWDDLQIQSMVYEREAALWPQVLGLGNSMHASVKPFSCARAGTAPSSKPAPMAIGTFLMDVNSAPMGLERQSKCRKALEGRAAD